MVTLPEGVESAIRRQLGTHIATIRDRMGNWVQIKADIPPDEEVLYKTKT